MTKIISNSEAETFKTAEEIATKLKDGGMLCLYGDLGSGKTTFTKGLANALGINHFTIKSPTYTYIREYELEGKNIYHIDLYRLTEPSPELSEEIEELTGHNSILIIEWADKMDEYLPQSRINVSMKYLGPQSREITIEDDRARN